MRIALIYPRVLHQFKSNLFPLGLLSIGTIIKQSGHEIKIFDSSFDRKLDSLKQKIKEYDPDVSGISATSDLMGNAAKIISFCKRLGNFTILGGSHATVAPIETLQNIPDLDYIVIGEGELTLLDLLESLEHHKNISDVQGIAYRHGSKIALTVKRNPYDLDSLPIPDRKLMPNLDKYFASGIAGISMMRGCPFNCKFCQPAERKMFGNKIRFRNCKNIIEEIRLIYEELGISELYICNDLFTQDKAWIRSLIDKMRDSRLLGKIKFIVLSRVDLFDKELAVLLRDLNVHRVLFGVESGSKAVLEFLNKQIKISQIERAFKLAKKEGIKTHGLFMLGTPVETEDTLLETEKLINKISPDQVMFSLYTALPGTKLYKEHKERNELDLKSFDQYDFYSFSRFGSNVKIQTSRYGDIKRFKNRILKKRKARMVLMNGIEMFRNFGGPKDLKKLTSRWTTYRRCRHFFG